MYGILHPLYSFLKPKEVSIDNIPFKLHYRVTTTILLCSSILISCKQFFGDPIHCFTAFKEEVPEAFLNTFCWMQSTFILPGSLNKETGIEVLAPGIDKHVGQDRVFLKYYQWVALFLTFQALCFYLPRFIWKTLEGNRISQVSNGLKNPLESQSDSKRTQIKQMTSYIMDNLGGHKLYTLSYCLCEILNFANVILQIFLTDQFLGGEFTTYGSEVLSFTQKDQEYRYDPMIKVFPRLSKCSFHKFGPSGDIQRHDALCILALNIINEKIFIVIWFWFIILAIISGCQLFYRVAWLLIERLRYRLLIKFNQRVTRDQLRRIAFKFGIGDWFFMQLLSKNMHSLSFRELVSEIDQHYNNGFTEDQNHHLSLLNEHPKPYNDKM